MKWPVGILLILLAAGLATIVLAVQDSPGYMDADYYFAGGVRLAEGHGFSEMILWNYLDDPTGLPHPSHGYWMPLASLAAAAGMLATGQAIFSSARLVFIMVALSIPLLVASLAWRLSGRRKHALLAGLLAVFSGFYLPYLYTTESFGLYMLFGCLFLLALSDGIQERDVLRWPFLKPLLLGLLAGSMHLTRADGFLWLAVGAGIIIFYRERSVAFPLFACLTGYLLVMGPWLLHNLAVFGAPLAPGGSRALWLTNYDELFVYPGSLLTSARWLASGFSSIVQARLWALGTNLQSALAVQGLVFLTPLSLAGLWRLRSSPTIKAGLFAWLLTITAMTAVFPFQGARGGFFHSGAAVQPLFWAAVPSGLDAFIEWGARRRGWKREQAWRVFGMGVVVLAAVFTGLLAFQRLNAGETNPTATVESPASIMAENEAPTGWNASWQRYHTVESALQSAGADPQAVVMVNNAPGYFAAVGRPAVSIPFGDRLTLLAAAHRYGVGFLLVELDQVRGESLFSEPGDRAGLRYIGTRAEVQIYAILPP